MPKISVIVPVYKVEPYLRRCVDSILAQTFTDFELILIDDGSPDNCGAVCDEYAGKDARVKVIHKENGGVSAARNTGLNAAQGDYIAFCDGDDCCKENWLRSLYSAISGCSADIACSGYVYQDENGVPIYYASAEAGQFDLSSVKDKLDFMIRNVLLSVQRWAVWNKLFKKETIELHEIRFNENCGNYAEDMCFVLSFLMYCQKAAVDCNSEYCYVKHNNTMMSNSKASVKLDQVNEVSKAFGRVYFSETHLKNGEEFFSLIHFLIFKLEFMKLFGTENERCLKKEISKISDRVWFRRHFRKAMTAFGLFAEYLGEPEAQKAMLIISYCLHRSWTLHKYISGAFYRFIYKGASKQESDK